LEKSDSRRNAMASRRKRLALLATALTVLSGFAAGAVYALSVEVPARGMFALKQDKVELLRGVARLIGEPTDAAVQKIVLNPGEGPSWHTHAGPAVAIVKTGQLTLVDDDCSETSFSAGQVFVDEGFGHVHRAYNPGPASTELWVTYIIPQGAGLIIPASAPGCAGA
jgi:quercetin dioxygenase-like cupin family protein